MCQNERENPLNHQCILLVLKEANYMSLERGYAYLLMRMRKEEDDGETLEPWGKPWKP